MHERFTLQSARQILPEVRVRLGEAMRAREELERVRQSVAEFSARAQLLGGVSLDMQDAARWHGRVREAGAALEAAMEKLQALGVQVKDLEMGLVDFPTVYRGREVLLCWRMGEPDIAWWHGTEEGFRGRKPVDADFERHHHGGEASEA